MAEPEDFYATLDELLTDPYWSDTQKALVVHLRETFRKYSWTLTTTRVDHRPHLVVAFEGIGDPGGRIELVDDEIQLWYNGKKARTLRFNDPMSIDHLEAFIGQQRDISDFRADD
jgi:hypothetical protein